jgi:hypothetical protein
MAIKTRNLERESIVRTRAYPPIMLRLPIGDATLSSGGNVGIVTTIALTAVGTQQTLTLNAAGVGHIVGAGGQLIMPYVPMFTTSVNTNTFSFIMRGWNQFGEFITESGTKTASSLPTRFALSAYCRIYDIRVTPIVLGTPGVDTISVGWEMNTGANFNRIALPFRPRTTADCGTHLLPITLGGGTSSNTAVGQNKVINFTGTAGFTPIDGQGATTTNANMAQAVIALTLGMTAQNTSPIEFMASMPSDAINTDF